MQASYPALSSLIFSLGSLLFALSMSKTGTMGLNPAVLIFAGIVSPISVSLTWQLPK
jgi:hypothetical protein